MCGAQRKKKLQCFREWALFSSSFSVRFVFIRKNSSYEFAFDNMNKLNESGEKKLNVRGRHCRYHCDYHIKRYAYRVWGGGRMRLLLLFLLLIYLCILYVPIPGWFSIIPKYHHCRRRQHLGLGVCVCFFLRL